MDFVTDIFDGIFDNGLKGNIGKVKDLRSYIRTNQGVTNAWVIDGRLQMSKSGSVLDFGLVIKQTFVSNENEPQYLFLTVDDGCEYIVPPYLTHYRY